MENLDPTYECDAPLYVDFEQMKRWGGIEDDGADSWFERQVVDEVDVNNNVNTEICTEEESENDEKTYISTDTETVTTAVSPRPKREAAQRASSSIHSMLVKKLQPMTLTMPKTPDVLKRYHQRKISVGKTTEELELERIKELRKAAGEHLQESKKSFKKIMAKQESNDKQEDNTKESDNQHIGTKRRRRSSKPLCQVEGRIDELSKSKKPKCDAYVPMAEQLMKFHKRTPPRFRTKRPDTPHINRKPDIPHDLTKPKTPRLITKTRSRPVHVESAAEKEEKEMKEVESFQFKAKPFNPKVVTLKGRLGVPVIEKKLLTRPMAPALTTESKPKHSEEESVKREEFRARPLPKDILEGVKGLPEKRLVECTNPESPNFALKKRKMEWDSKKKEPTPEPPPKARPVPSAVHPVFEPELPHKATVVQPFSFESRYEGKPTRQDIVDGELRKQAEELAEKSQFKANPMPDFSIPLEMKLPERKIEPQPFQLQSDKRGEKYREEFREKVKLEEEDAQTVTEFKATRSNVVHRKRFEPEIPARPPLQVQNFTLNTEQRSQQRALYEEKKKEKDQMKEEEVATKRAEDEVEERKRITEYRRSLQYHAQPIKHYKPVEVCYGNKELTTPLTPTLITSQRSRIAK